MLSMDAEIGELERGSVLIEDGRIAAVGRELGEVDAETIDAGGGVIMPGFVDTHRHTWQTSLRAICTDWTLFDYTIGMRMTISPRCSAEDVYAGNHVGALEALDAGVTTILDFSHCNNSPEHADQAIQGLLDAGIRAHLRLRLLPPAGRRPALHEPRDAARGLQARGARARGAPRRPGHDGDLAHRAGARALRRHAARGRDGARAAAR